MSSFLSDLGRLVLIGLAVNFAAPIQGQTSLAPAGGEFLLSGAQAGDQCFPGLSLGPQGGFAVWQDNAIDGAGWGIAGRHLAADGSPAGYAFRVNKSAANNQERPQVAAFGDGGGAFVWLGGPVGFQTVYARFMNASGGFTTDDVLVSRPFVASTNRAIQSYSVVRNNRTMVRRFIVSKVDARRRDYSANPVVGVLGDGSVLVAYAGYQRWTTNTPAVLPQVRYYTGAYVTNSVLVPNEQGLDLMHDIYARRFTQAGVAIGDEFRINQFTKYNQRNAAVAVLPNGSFVVVWISENQGVSEADIAAGRNRQDVYARLFNSAGLALGDEFRVNDAASANNSSPSVAVLAGGGFRVAWAQAAGDRTKSMDVFTRAFDASGASSGAVAQVNTYTRGDQFNPRLASCPAGELILWTSLNQDGSAEGVFGRWLSGGSPAGAEFRVNTTTVLRQYQQAICSGPDNAILAAWCGYNHGSGFDIFAQRYAASNP